MPEKLSRIQVRPEQHRAIKSIAAKKGMTIPDFIEFLMKFLEDSEKFSKDKIFTE